MDKNEIAALLESLCERPFAGDPDGPAGMDVSAGRAPSPGAAEASGSVDPQAAADLAAILSGTATDAQCQAFQEAAMRSSAVRLEAQSALAFLDGIDAAPRAAPAHLLEQVLGSSGGAPSPAQPGIWSRLAGRLMGRRVGQVAAACVVMLVAGGVSWSLWRSDVSGDGVAIPTATSPKAGAPVIDIEPKPALTPAAPPAPAASPAPPVFPMQPASPEQPGLPGRSVSPLAGPPLVSPAPELAPAPPPAQALVDPCGPRLATSETPARSKVEPKAAKPAPSQPQSRTAAATAPDPGCGVNVGIGAVEAVQKPQADRGPVRAAKPAANAVSPAAGGYPAAAPVKRPSANAPPR